MKNEFNGFYGLQEQEVKHLWENAHFVFDANVLLNLYRYQESTTKQLIDVIERFKDRVWVPYHVALEYQRNRLKVIASQHSKFSEVKKVVNSCTSTMQGELNKLQLSKRHSTITPDAFISDINAAGEKFLKELDTLEKEHFSVVGDDQIRIRLDTLLDGKVGPRPSSQEAIKSLEKEAETRFKNKVPPGYMDDKKDQSGEPIFSYADLSYQRKYSDYIVWAQVVEYAKESQLSDLIFITDDNKEDWWLKVKQNGEKTISPRPELKGEISQKSGVKRFHMYSSEGFLKQANEQLNAGVSEETIEEVRDVSTLASKISFPAVMSFFSKSITRLLVLNWLKTQYDGEVKSSIETIGVDYITRLDEISVAINLVEVQSPDGVIGLVSKSIVKAHHFAKKSGMDKVRLILQVPQVEVASEITAILTRELSDLPLTECTIGTISGGGDIASMKVFEELVTFSVGS
ncbi:DUF4935 domain-containing protein [Shewanella eurypsychrophilus]|uniref:DUF4935 domain-containing protein n=1 Tax=Shewanella eurypsychrophilus TaxID=2593656 RepID=A0ABX6V8J4_9GAMM|nr:MULTISPECIES: PIN-like domain-containing protein [Shewanella]QFU23754.1 hypothetical protein FS418_19080 [Shewanella sp. YLB-09]QPG58977.1 DUF4935 domain-containing protein [Shewanella eurypsychrophilus]